MIIDFDVPHAVPAAILCCGDFDVTGQRCRATESTLRASTRFEERRDNIWRPLPATCPSAPSTGPLTNGRASIARATRSRGEGTVRGARRGLSDQRPTGGAVGRPIVGEGVSPAAPICWGLSGMRAVIHSFSCLRFLAIQECATLVLLGN